MACQGLPKGCLCELPIDFLVLVLQRLSVVDYLAVRTVCRCWRSAFVICSELYDCWLRKQPPWVIFLYAKGRVQPDFFARGKFGNSLNRRVYGTKSPGELVGAQFLLSKYGWILLFSSSSMSGDSSFFFLNPFSGARIDLPFLDVSSLNCPVFAISAPPTSQDCIVFFSSSKTKCGPAARDVKVGICRRGEDNWSTAAYSCEDLDGLSYVNNIAFAGSTFYCLYHTGHLAGYDACSSSWRFFGKPKTLQGTLSLLIDGFVSVVVENSRETFLCIKCGSSTHCELNLSSGNNALDIVSEKKLRRYLKLLRKTILRSPETAIAQLNDNCMKLDSFSLTSWFRLCKYTVGEDRFYWCNLRHWRCQSFLHDEARLYETIAWFEPRWVEPSLCPKWFN